MNEFNQRKNIKILSDQTKWTPINSVNYCDFAIGVNSSLSDEILALGKVAIVVDWFGCPDKIFDFGKILAKNYDEILEKLNLIVEDYKKNRVRIFKML